MSVTALDLAEAVALYDVREVLDGLAARLAARHAGAAELAGLARALAAMRRCVERGDAHQWFPAHVSFHDGIFKASGNARLTALATVVPQSIQHFHPLLLKTERRLEAAFAEHRAVFEAIAAHDAAAAERHARAHITHAKAVVERTMARATKGERHGAVQG